MLVKQRGKGETKGKNQKTKANAYIQRQTLPLAVPPATQFLLRWKAAADGTAVMLSPPSWAS